MKLAVVILNWNSARDTIACVQRLATWRSLKPDIWVVDNGSADGSAVAIDESCAGIELVRSESNRGFGGGNNLGISRARRNGAEAVLLLNNDAVIDEADVARLIHVLETRPSAGVVGPIIRERSEERTWYSLGGRDIASDFDTRILTAHLPRDRSQVSAVDYVPGSAALIRTAVFDRVSGFDEAFFFSGEMADFCVRARESGYESLIVWSAMADHHDGAGDRRQTLYAYYSLRNRFLYVRKHGRWWQLVLWSARCLRTVMRHVRRRSLSTARCHWLALVDGLRGRYGDQHGRVQPG